VNSDVGPLKTEGDWTLSLWKKFVGLSPAEKLGVLGSVASLIGIPLAFFLASAPSPSQVATGVLTSEDISASVEIASNLPSQVFFEDKTKKFNLSISNTSLNVWSNLTADVYIGLYLNPKAEDFSTPKTLYYSGNIRSLPSTFPPGKVFTVPLAELAEGYVAMLDKNVVELKKNGGLGVEGYLSVPVRANVFDFSKVYFGQNQITSNNEILFKKVEELSILDKKDGSKVIFPSLKGDVSAVLRIVMILKGHAKQQVFKKLLVANYGWAATKRLGAVEHSLVDFSFMSNACDLGLDLVQIDKFGLEWKTIPTRNLFTLRYEPSIQTLNSRIRSEGIDFNIDNFAFRGELDNGLFAVALKFFPYGKQSFHDIDPKPYGQQVKNLVMPFSDRVKNITTLDKLL
jgi:hypothetical protein